MLTLAWGSKVTPEFRDKVIQIADAVGCDPSHLMACMMFESRLDPTARNPQSGATGLIQFMPSTALNLGTTVEQLAAMSAVDQLSYVYAYLKPFAGRLKTLSELYMAILLPTAIGDPEDRVLFGEGSKAYVQNKGLDLNRDGTISKAEATAYVARRLEEGLLPTNVATLMTGESAPVAATEQPTPKEAPMGAAMFLPAVLQMVPQLVAMFSKGGKAEANQKIAEMVVGAFTQAVPGAVNAQQAVEMAQADPQVRAAAAQAVLSNPTVELMMQIGPSGMQEARAANVALVAAADKPWKLLINPVLLVTVMLLPLVYILTIRLSQFLDKVSPDVIANQTGIIIGMVLGAICGFWMGQIYQQNVNRRSTDPQTVPTA